MPFHLLLCMFNYYFDKGCQITNVLCTQKCLSITDAHFIFEWVFNISDELNKLIS